MCFGGDSGGNTVERQVIQQGTLPAWAEKAGEEKYGQAKTLTERPYPVYDEARLAGFTPDQLAGFQKIRDGVGGWKVSLDKASSQVGTAAAPFDKSQLDQYIDPYMEKAIDPVVSRINRQFDRGQVLRDLDRAKLGTRGNDRNAVGDALAARDRDELVAQVVGQGYSTAFNRALDQYNADKTRGFQAADAYAKLASTEPQLNFADAAALGQSGAQQQAQEQSNLSLRFEDFLKQFYYPQEQLNFLTATLGGTPLPTGSATTSPVPVGNSTAQGIGALASLLGAGSMFKTAFF